MDVGSIQAENTRMMQSAQRVGMQNKIKQHDVNTMSALLEGLKQAVPPDPNLGKNIDITA